MPQPRPPHSYRKPPQFEFEAAVTRAEIIRAVRTIIDGSGPAETAAPHNPEGSEAVFEQIQR